MKYINLPLTASIGLIMLSSILSAFAKPIANIYPLPKSYYNETKLHKDLSIWTKAHPELTKLHSIGKTAHGKRPIYALQIQSGIDRIPVLLIGQHHGDEVLGIEIVMSFTARILNNQNTESIRLLLDKYAFWIVPTLTPDAWQVVTSGKYQWKRKNNTDTNKDGKLNVKTDGVDLNRNYPTFWHLDQVLPESNRFFKGESPASESEIKAILHLAELMRFRYAFFYHSSVSGVHSERIYLPWQDLKDTKTKDDFAEMHKIAEVYADAVPKDYQKGNYDAFAGNTSRTGNARNHFYYQWKTFAWDIEVGGNNKKGKGIVQPKWDMRNKIVHKNLQALLLTLYSIGD